MVVQFESLPVLGQFNGSNWTTTITFPNIPFNTIGPELPPLSDLPTNTYALTVNLGTIEYPLFQVPQMKCIVFGSEYFHRLRVYRIFYRKSSPLSAYFVTKNC